MRQKDRANVDSLSVSTTGSTGSTATFDSQENYRRYSGDAGSRYPGQRSGLREFGALPPELDSGLREFGKLSPELAELGKLSPEFVQHWNPAIGTAQRL
jgi:hypothetical protein